MDIPTATVIAASITAIAGITVAVINMRTKRTDVPPKAAPNQSVDPAQRKTHRSAADPFFFILNLIFGIAFITNGIDDLMHYRYKVISYTTFELVMGALSLGAAWAFVREYKQSPQSN